MTPEEQDLIMGLAFVPGVGRTRTLDEVLAHFGESDGGALALRLLRDAMERRDADDVEMALLLHAAADAPVGEFMEPLIEMFPAEWHREHEDIVSMLGRLRAPRTVPTLVLATRWVPERLDFDDCRALAVKAIWALGGIPGPEAREALEGLRDDENEIIRENAVKQLARRGEL
ncbi:HEAT repeat domain-containing protein [Streptomyces griseiscabiei]|uniref:HEAT repeat domain-containing protein n=1 Tax=Streptomyces griseiscabiei TaxID=2993540 RepID=A0ABU4L475_9ACTN|nr:HEAT repeat domain-containing protein [Streptomyces griseiscabiei]MBZ3905473.1 HEAT repeat domain-containing protein [Streptomyces griseiscabiei]MDX2910564.1 HEAT repeat domain-containing protein [Streptomyces griseiscabiei]